MPPGAALAMGGLVLTALGLHQLGYGLAAESVPYGFALVMAAVLLLIGSGLLLAAWLERRRAGGRTTVAGAAAVLTAATTAFTLGLLQLPSDDRDEGLRCRALNGNVYDCDDPRIDEPEERAAIVPGSDR